MIAFFFTMPIKSRIPIKPMMLSSILKSSSTSSAPTPAEGKLDKMVIGWT